jgi:hypothetical protein
MPYCFAGSQSHRRRKYCPKWRLAVAFLKKCHWDTLTQLYQPDLLLLTGDNVYGDCNETICHHMREAYKKLSLHPSFRGFEERRHCSPYWRPWTITITAKTMGTAPTRTRRRLENCLPSFLAFRGQNWSTRMACIKPECKSYCWIHGILEAYSTEPTSWANPLLQCSTRSKSPSTSTAKRMQRHVSTFGKC